MTRVSIPAQPDLVLLTWQRNPLDPGSARKIIESRIIGSASPCEKKLAPNSLLFAALKCLKKNGFVVVVSKKTTSVSGYVLLQRG